MEETIDKVQEELKEGKLIQDPHQCAEYISILSGELSFYLAKQGEISQHRAKNWLSIRKNCKSDNQAEREWDLTEKGMEYNWYDVRIKRCKHLITGLKTLIRMSEMEQMNLQ